MGVTTAVQRAGPRTGCGLRYPIAFVVTALALGLPYAWIVPAAARLLPWTKGFAIDMFSSRAGEALLPFALACAAVAWSLRRRIAQATIRSAWGLALSSALLGGPAYAFFLGWQSLILVPEQLGDGLADAMAVILGGTLAELLLGGAFGALFLPVTLPCTWASVLVLRAASGGLGPPAVQPG